MRPTATANPSAILSTRLQLGFSDDDNENGLIEPDLCADRTLLIRDHVGCPECAID